MAKMILVAVIIILIQITGSRAMTPVTPVIVQVGHDVILQVDKDTFPREFENIIWKVGEETIFVKFDRTSPPVLYEGYTGRVELFGNYSVKLKNLQKTDSGEYTARVWGKIDKDLIKYQVTVQDQVSPVMLTVDSVTKNSDSCNMTVSCRTQDSDISSTFTCDSQTCSQEGGQRSKVTTTGASLQVSMVNDSIICNHSNQVSSTQYQEAKKTRDLCIYYAGRKCLINTTKTSHANDDHFRAAEHRNSSRTNNASLAATRGLARPHNGPNKSTETREMLNRRNVQVLTAAHRQNPTRTKNASVSSINLLWPHAEPNESTDTTDTQPKTINAENVPAAKCRNRTKSNESSLFILMDSLPGPDESTETRAAPETVNVSVQPATESKNQTQIDDVSPSRSVDAHSGPEGLTELRRPPKPPRTFTYVPTAANSENLTKTDSVSPSCLENLTGAKEPAKTRAPPPPQRRNVQVPTAAACQNPTETNEAASLCSMLRLEGPHTRPNAATEIPGKPQPESLYAKVEKPLRH